MYANHNLKLLSVRNIEKDFANLKFKEAYVLNVLFNVERGNSHAT
ncbi:hypothetical protein MC28_0811 [Bacillus thuringiensis MC28]|nr:hypothetical protein MC28_0811 [Bacillus thuringiensis MC28]